MDSGIDILNDLISKDNYTTLPAFLDHLQSLFSLVSDVESTRSGPAEDFMKEISVFRQPNISLYFGNTFKDLKCVLTNKNNGRSHEMYLHYMGPKKFRIIDMDLPRSQIQGQDYASLEEVVNIFIKHVDALNKYFEQLDLLNLYQIVMEPVRPTFKESYRKIQLAPRMWLQFTVSPDGSANDLHVTGQDGQKHHELKDMLLAWDHDRDIATNVMTIIESLKSEQALPESTTTVETNQVDNMPVCGICYCIQLPGDTSIPQSLCNNSTCGIYLHRGCLYEWLVECNGGRPPAFGVAIGTCPNCLQHIQCNEIDV